MELLPIKMGNKGVGPEAQARFSGPVFSKCLIALKNNRETAYSAVSNSSAREEMVGAAYLVQAPTNDEAGHASIYQLSANTEELHYWCKTSRDTVR